MDVLDCVVLVVGLLTAIRASLVYLQIMRMIDWVYEQPDWARRRVVFDGVDLFGKMMVQLWKAPSRFTREICR